MATVPVTRTLRVLAGYMDAYTLQKVTKTAGLVANVPVIRTLRVLAGCMDAYILPRTLQIGLIMAG